MSSSLLHCHMSNALQRPFMCAQEVYVLGGSTKDNDDNANEDPDAVASDSNTPLSLLTSPVKDKGMKTSRTEVIEWSESEKGDDIKGS